MGRDPRGGWHGPLLALGSAMLFGASMPLAKLLLDRIDPWMLAGLLYLGAGVGLALMRALRAAFGAANGPRWGLRGAAWGWLAGAIVSGGGIGPVFLMWGLALTPASSAALLLNLEGVFTALLAWFAFRENFDRRIALGMLLIAAGAATLGWDGPLSFATIAGPAAIGVACLAWAIDNNLTRKVSLADPVTLVILKGLAAGTVNLSLAKLRGAGWPGSEAALAAGAVGLGGYGLSLVLYVLALRHVGTARTGAYFSVAPFVGAVIAVIGLGEPLTARLGVAGALMASGVWLHLTERHEHLHAHEAVIHSHGHVHDSHHEHAHSPSDPPGEPHTHEHAHEGLVHSHPHYPDAHHRHRHGESTGS
jgi:drug/metabolite transporter (DMT)-like permease